MDSLGQIRQETNRLMGKYSSSNFKEKLRITTALSLLALIWHSPDETSAQELLKLVRDAEK